jgi:protein ImuB
VSNEPLPQRYLSLWLPFLSADRWHCWRPEVGSEAGRPVVFIEKIKGASRLAAVNAQAQQQGLAPGMTLADARARMPDLQAVAYDRDADAAFLEQLAEIAVSFTPSVAIEAAGCGVSDGLILDITGCAHLFGGEAPLAARLTRALQAGGASACHIAVAPTPDMARALARYNADRFLPDSPGQPQPVFAYDSRLALMLPVAALECNAEDARALRRAGLRTIGHVADRPSVLFTARFTSAFTAKLRRVLGEEDRRITPRRPAPAYIFDERCAEPVASADVIEGIVGELAVRASVQLQERGEGGRLFQATFFRTDGARRLVCVETSQPVRAPAVLMRLYRDRLSAIADPLDPGFGFDLIRLQVLRAEPFSVVQTTLDARDEQQEHVAALVDRLGAIFGKERIMRLRRNDTHIPERAQTMVAASATLSGAAGKISSSAAGEAAALRLPPRPLHLFGPPQPIEVQSGPVNSGPVNSGPVNSGPVNSGQVQSGPGHGAGHPGPAGFRWRRVLHDVIHAEGPERIADEWWRTPSGYGARDYFRVETAEGRRFWIFRADATAALRAPAGADPVSAKWFLHGVFA